MRIVSWQEMMNFGTCPKSLAEYINTKLVVMVMVALVPWPVKQKIFPGAYLMSSNLESQGTIAEPEHEESGMGPVVNTTCRLLRKEMLTKRLHVETIVCQHLAVHMLRATWKQIQRYDPKV